MTIALTHKKSVTSPFRGEERNACNCKQILFLNRNIYQMQNKQITLREMKNCINIITFNIILK